MAVALHCRGDSCPGLSGVAQLFRRMRLDKGRTGVSVPRKSLLLLSGIPAVGKSSFGRYLAREHNFALYDLECHPRGWPHPELKRVWDSSRANFVAQLKGRHDRIALDWGFPPQAMPQVRELLALGVRCVWFVGDEKRENCSSSAVVFLSRTLIFKCGASKRQACRKLFSAPRWRR